jgi:hypothetical protein
MLLSALLALCLPASALTTRVPAEHLPALRAWFAGPSLDTLELGKLLPAGATLSKEDYAAMATAASAKIDVLLADARSWSTPQAKMTRSVAALKLLSERLSPSLDKETDVKLSLGYLEVRNNPMMTAMYRAERWAEELMGSPGQDVDFGAFKVRKDAPGSKELVLALSREDEVPVLGIYRLSTGEIVNAFAHGRFGVQGHAQALPPGMEKSDAGGYTFLLRRGGEPSFLSSGTFPAPVTARLRRAVSSYLGLRPARETRAQRWKRRFWAAWDRLTALIS